MPSFCAVVHCNDRYGHSENISFHKFPLKRKDLLEQWEAFIQKQRGAEWRASRWSSLCSRHFREDDFRSLNERRTLKKSAVPSILIDVVQTVKNKISPSTPGEEEGDVSSKDKEFKEIMAIREQLEDVATTPKTNCRLCGVSSIPVVTFTTNYELYGMLQKCFPTLNIQQEDAFPKVLCSSCYKNLQQFGEFVDIVWAAQTELQRKYKSRTVEKPPLKIKQEPLAVRVKQEVAEVGYDQQQAVNANVGVGANDDYDVMGDGNHEDGDDSGAVDQKYEFCDFPINDCDIMEIINLDDPFINIPDDDNTIVNEETEEVQKPINERINHLPSAHELLQAHMLLDEHNYAYVDTTDDFKEERQVYKTEKSDSEERLNIEASTIPLDSGNNAIYEQPSTSYSQEMMNTQFENRRALKPIVTSVSAIQASAPSKGNSIVVLNESIVKSGSGGCQLHSCMVCHLNFFSVENLKEHYTQTHGTPMVTVPASNIVFERNSSDSKCNMKKEIIENIEICSAKNVSSKMPEIVAESTNITEEGHVEKQEETKLDNVTNDSTCSPPLKSKNITKNIRHGNALRKTRSKSKHQQHKVNKLARSYPHMISLNTMASQYQQLKKLYQTLQKKCLNLEQNVEQLQLLPATINSKPIKTLRQQVQQTKSLNNKSDPKPMLPPMADSRTMMPPTSVTPTKSTCPICLKMFPNSNSLRQHKITHTEERKHICTLCQRSFKRRNGLLQHFKGFHLQVKPFTCQICNHSYALKCDMLRCKHSALKSSRNTTTEQ